MLSNIYMVEKSTAQTYNLSNWELNVVAEDGAYAETVQLRNMPAKPSLPKIWVLSEVTAEIFKMQP